MYINSFSGKMENKDLNRRYLFITSLFAEVTKIHI